MAVAAFDRDGQAKWYAREHLKTDPGIKTVVYLPQNAGPREIRFVEINTLIGDVEPEILEPIDFGVDMGSEDHAHQLLVLDVTPDQFDRIQQGGLALPDSWSLDGAVEYQ